MIIAELYKASCCILFTNSKMHKAVSTMQTKMRGQKAACFFSQYN